MKSIDPHAGHDHPDPEMPEGQGVPETGTGPTAIDPVCGMTVTLKPDTRTEALAARLPFLLRQVPDEVQGRSVVLRLGPRGRAQESRCQPMCNTPARCTPRSSVTHRGSCPICGMALEPMLPSDAAQP